MSAAVLVLALAGCKPAGDTPPKLEPVGAALVAQQKMLCEGQGGDWVASTEGLICQHRPKDGGQSCRSGSDCEGACLARSMTCAPVVPLLGCNEVITASGLRVTECVE
ncbi:MAG: hypothetical protein PHX82_01130 [Paracoccaceae bacterium]|nr:hypothetical protein [Paracoccaceae bacterium]